jgi:hypothetical protein
MSRKWRDQDIRLHRHPKLLWKNLVLLVAVAGSTPVFFNLHFLFSFFFVRWAGRDGTRNTRYTSLSNKYVLLLLRIYYRLVFLVSQSAIKLTQHKKIKIKFHFFFSFLPGTKWTQIRWMTQHWWEKEGEHPKCLFCARCDVKTQQI